MQQYKETVSPSSQINNLVMKDFFRGIEQLKEI